MVTMYFVRHGQSEANVKGGFFDDSHSPLTELGFEQARKVGERLGSLGIKFDAVYSSPYCRAWMTCRETMDAGNIEVQVSFDASLKERDFSGLYGRVISKEHYIDLWNYESEQDAEDGIETLRNLEARAVEFLKYIKQAHDGHKILVFSHGGLGLAVRAALFGRPENGSLYSWPLLRNGEYMILGF